MSARVWSSTRSSTTTTPTAPRLSNTLDLGGRYKLRHGLNLLFMAGRSVLGKSGSQVEFTGYLGIQILE
jgi:hypothetical protein